MKRSHRWMMTTVSLALLAGCGGGGPSSDGGGVVVNPPPTSGPPPAPPPPPPPPPPPLSQISGPISLTQMRDFAALGWAYSFTSHDVPGGIVAGPERPDRDASFEFSYLAEAGAYEARIPGFKRGRLETLSLNGSPGNWSGTYNAVLDPDSGGRQSVAISLPLPNRNTSLNLVHSSIGSVSGQQSLGADRYENQVGAFGFGVPTPANGRPLTGVAAFATYGQAWTSVPGVGYPYYVDTGTSLSIDFARGTFSGSISADVYYDWEASFSVPIELKDVVTTGDGTTFSGALTVAGVPETGFIEGRLTGPNAEEMIARWLVPFVNPLNKQTAIMFGTLVGKRK